MTRPRPAPQARAKGDKDDDNDREDNYMEKPQDEFTPQNFRVNSLDRVAHNVIQSTISDGYFIRVMKC